MLILEDGVAGVGGYKKKKARRWSGFKWSFKKEKREKKGRNL